MRYDLHANKRAAAQVYPNGCKVWRKTIETAGVQRFEAAFFYPKATNPVWYYTFKTIARRHESIDKALAAFDAHEARKTADRAEKKASLASADYSQVDPGAIFRYSWGYDQTNVEYFQVVKRSGSLVTLREIGAESVDDGHVRAAKDSFVTQCKVCRCTKDAFSHSEHSPRDDAHAYVHGYNEIAKRVRFGGGVPRFSMDHGCLSPVKVLKFGNADALVAETNYQTPFGMGH